MKEKTFDRRFMNRALAMQAVLVAASAMAFTATAETASPQSFVDSIYKHYLGKDFEGPGAVQQHRHPPLFRLAAGGRDGEGFRRRA